MRQRRHTSDPRILDARTLADDFSALVPFLKPGLRVLDVGCGPGALSEGVAHIVGPTGEVVGVDRDELLIARASARAPDMAWLRFELRDALTIDGDARFDLVATARTLQWISADDLPAVLARLTNALVPGGWLVALDYNHRGHRWSPEPPDELPWFVERFRAWREASRWLSDVLPVAEGMLPVVGLRDVRTQSADQRARRGEPRFAAAATIWPKVIETLGPKMAEEGFISVQDVERSLDVIGRWCEHELLEQTMAARVMTARRARGADR